MSYNPPFDFTLPSPPYYRPASSVTLTCISEDGTEPLQYRWSSTCSDCFTSDNSSSHISINILKSTDAGIHTCTVIDAAGETGFAITEMKLIGKFKSSVSSYVVIQMLFDHHFSQILTPMQVLVYISHRVNTLQMLQYLITQQSSIHVELAIWLSTVTPTPQPHLPVH